MDLGLNGRVAMVTGASKGMGKASALALAEEGCKVAICSRTQSDLDEAVRELQAFGNAAIGVRADATDQADLKRFYEETVAALGEVDIVVNAVGGAAPGTVDTMTDEEWQLNFDRNLFPGIRLIRMALPGMKERKWGRIVNIGSVTGREFGPDFEMTRDSLMGYMSAKAALIAMTKHMAIQLAPHEILVNMVAPGIVTYPGGRRDLWSKTQTPEAMDEFFARHLPMGRFGWPEPVGALVAFLCSEKPGFLSGACINFDGAGSRSLL
ncbi:MAG: SDR family oxidoreductase [SAR202 cluster bacterium]|jgi:3-oxoacyl-[acyl-carrier protein] reductase|nr:SDR family oxidoreductase [SAR202 cluster bacterium]